MLRDKPDTERNEDDVDDAWLVAVCRLAERQLEVTALCCFSLDMRCRLLYSMSAARHLLHVSLSQRTGHSHSIKGQTILMISEQCIRVRCVHECLSRICCVSDAAAVHRTAQVKAQTDCYRRQGGLETDRRSIFVPCLRL